MPEAPAHLFGQRVAWEEMWEGRKVSLMGPCWGHKPLGRYSFSSNWVGHARETHTHTISTLSFRTIAPTFNVVEQKRQGKPLGIRLFFVFLTANSVSCLRLRWLFCHSVPNSWHLSWALSSEILSSEIEPSKISFHFWLCCVLSFHMRTWEFSPEG